MNASPVPPSPPASPRVPQSRVQRHADLHLLRERGQAGEQGQLRGRENIREYSRVAPEGWQTLVMGRVLTERC